MSGIGAKLPLHISEDDGAYGLTKTIQENTKQNFKMLCLTIPGERIMDPLFGVGLSRFLFENSDDLTSSEIRVKIREQVSKYMPFIEIKEIIIDKIRDIDVVVENSLFVKIFYKILPLDIEDILSIPEQN